MKQFAILLAAVCVLHTIPALSTPVQCPATGNWYEFVPNLVTYTDATAAVSSMTYLGMQGHLATITSQQEQDWVWSYLSAQNHPNHIWIGAFQNPTNGGSGNNWHWVTGEAWSYTSWFPGEPNDYLGRPEDFVQLLFNDGGLWNDQTDDTPACFLVEYTGTIPTEERTWGSIKALFRP